MTGSKLWAYVNVAVGIAAAHYELRALVTCSIFFVIIWIGEHVIETLTPPATPRDTER